jgi:RNA polymerase sigma-B factor
MAVPTDRRPGLASDQTDGSDEPDREELQRLFEEYRSTDDMVLRDRLVEAHLGLAEYLARRFDRRGEPLDDLIQVASLALIKAVERFDPSRGLEFSTFAVPTIVGELKRHFRDKSWAVRVSRRLQELHLRLGTAVSDLTHELGRSPTIPEIATRLDVTSEEVLEAMEAGRAYRSSSLDVPVSGDDAEGNTPLSARLGDTDDNLKQVDERSQLASLLRDLPERERTILVLRFYDGLTQSQIAERIGISQMHVSRLLSRTLEQLRERALATDEPPPEID